VTVTVDVSPATDRRRETFFRLLFGKNGGYICIAFLGKKTKDFREQFFRYPADIPKMLDAINNGLGTHNVYFCPQLLRERKRQKEFVESAPSIWADLDTCHPERMLLKPSVVLESSPGRFQAFWVTSEDIDVDDAEALAQRIAYYHADDGADRSGWDLTQLLRVPMTYNYKYDDEPVVVVVEANKEKFSLDQFDIYPAVEGYSFSKIPMPSVMPDKSAEELLQERRQIINPMVWRLFNEVPTTASWSEPLWNLQMLLFEAGYSREEVFVLAQESKCNKYARDGRQANLLWKEVCRAEQHHVSNEGLMFETKSIAGPGFDLLTAQERITVEQQPDTFIERYHTWARSLGDAAPQYHKAGAFIVLSSLLAGAVRLPTSFGTIVPNLWFMILADTTLTRKTTAMDIAMDLVMEVDEDVVMATDGSIEGLLTSLSTRPGRPSVFLRDEFSGLLEQMTKKDYMAGMPELLTKLYDGKFQKRILRKEIIEVRDPVLIVFAGGIKAKVAGLLNYEMVSSGFMPRFIFITAESDVSKLKPIGPPTVKSTGDRDAILNELRDLYAYYRTQTMMKVDKLSIEIAVDKKFDAQLTPEAWVRYNKLEADLLQAGLDAGRPEIMTPVNDRLSKSILKAAVLLSASQKKSDPVVVEEIDLLRAMYYAEAWKTYVGEIMEDVGKTYAERQLYNILGLIVRKPGVSRSEVMQNFHLDARDATQLFETMEQRGLIVRQKAGRGETLYPAREGVRTHG
jgi:hypothetical protein